MIVGGEYSLHNDWEAYCMGHSLCRLRAAAPRACSFCRARRRAAIRAGGLCLCAACEAQLVALDPRARAYDWFVAAITRARLARA